jgi:hypothetical protein
MVINLSALKSGSDLLVMDDIQAVVDAAGMGGALVKVILDARCSPTRRSGAPRGCASRPAPRRQDLDRVRVRRRHGRGRPAAPGRGRRRDRRQGGGGYPAVEDARALVEAGASRSAPRTPWRCWKRSAKVPDAPFVVPGRTRPARRTHFPRKIIVRDGDSFLVSRRRRSASPPIPCLFCYPGEAYDPFSTRARLGRPARRARLRASGRRTAAARARPGPGAEPASAGAAPDSRPATALLPLRATRNRRHPRRRRRRSPSPARNPMTR